MKNFPMIRSLKSAIVGTVLVALPMMLLSVSPLTGLYAGLLFLLVFPAALCMVGTVCGLAPMALDALAGLYGLYMLLGWPGVGLGALFLLPVLGCFLGVVGFRVSFWRASGLMILAHIVSFVALYLVGQGMTENSLYAFAANQAVEAVTQNRELGDALLYQLYSMGLIGVPDALQENMAGLGLGGLLVLSDAARQDMLLSLRALIEDSLAALVPNLIISQSLLCGTLGFYAALRFGFLAQEKREFVQSTPPGAVTDTPPPTDPPAEKHQVDFPDLNVPPLCAWHIPRGKGWQVGVALVIGYLLASNAGAMGLAGGMLYAAAITLFEIQGAAVINFMQRARGNRRGWRVAAPLLLMGLSLLSYVGIFDQLTNIRGIRKPPERMEDE